MTFRIHASIALVLALLISTFAGCGSPADRLVKRQIDLMNQFSAAVENEASETVFNDLERQLRENSERLEELDLSRDEMQALKEKYEPQLEEAGKRFTSAISSKVFKDFPGAPGGMPRFPFGGQFPGSRR